MFAAFIVALFTEMYGFPLTIYLLAGWLSDHYPGVNLLSHDAGYLWNTLLGLESSPSFVREPEGNGVAERFIRALKENFLWVHTFDTIEELRRALLEFARHDNDTWLVARHGHRTPVQVRADQRRVDRPPAAKLALAA